MNLEFGTSVFVGQHQTGLSALSDLEFFVLVGVTGVGKTTTLEALTNAGWQFSSLPDRRIVTDLVMIEPLAGKAVTDREERFALTAKYRKLHPGGMAQAIGMLQLKLEQVKTPLVFDGLRGLEEVRFAASTYAKSRFIVLDAPDETRVERLLGRSDVFDAISGATSSAATLEQIKAIKGVESVFSKTQLEKFAGLEHQGLSASEIVAKTKIVVTERRNYNPIEARDYLLQLDSKRVLYVDTTAATPEIIALRIMDWV
jgi:energy-coupling factor transporter ATP-binding protein EcfA2